MDQDLLDKLGQIEQKIEETRKLADRTYKIILWTMIGSVVVFVLPLIALAFVIPYFLKTLTSITGI
jgi:type II secretory pathway component PulF